MSSEDGTWQFFMHSTTVSHCGGVWPMHLAVWLPCFAHSVSIIVWSVSAGRLACKFVYVCVCVRVTIAHTIGWSNDSMISHIPFVGKGYCRKMFLLCVCIVSLTQCSLVC